MLEQQPGLTVELLHEVARNAGVELELKRMPWKRCILLLANNQIDGAFEVSYKPAREEFAVYPYTKAGELDKQRYLHSLSYYLYTMKDSGISWDGVKIHQLAGTLVAVAGYSIVDDMRKEGYPVLEGVSQKANLEMLLRGRVDGLAQIDSMTQGIINKNPDRYRDVIRHPIPLRSKLYYLVFSKGFIEQQGAVAEKLWDQLSAIRASGGYEDIATRYVD